MKRIQISIDRSSRSVGIFEDFKCILPFYPYDSEKEAEDGARKWILDYIGEADVEIVYPRIDSVRFSSVRKRS